jgi:uncharacterized protein YukE
MGKHEDELNRVAGAGEWDVPHILGLNVALTTFRRSLTKLAESDSWKGAAAEGAGTKLTKLSTDMGKIQDALDSIAKTIDAANASRSRAVGAAAELPSADVDPFWENVAKAGSVVVHPVLGPLAADSAIDAIEGWLGGQREDAAKAALETMQSETSGYAASIDQQRSVIEQNTPRDDVWDLELPEPESEAPPSIDPGWNGPSYGGPGAGGRPPGYTGPSVDGSLDPTYPSVPGGGPDPVRPGVPNLPGGPGTPSVPGGPGTPGLPGGPGGTFPGGPGGVPGGPGGTGTLPGHIPGGGGLLGGIGGGAAGAAALAAGAKAVGAGGAGMRLGGLGAGGVGGPGGAGGAGGAGARGANGLLGRAGALEGGGAGGGAAGANGAGGSGAGGRGTTGMMGGQGGGQGGSERERRNGLGGPIAPKLEDEEENGPRSRGAGAGGRG